MNAPGLLEYVEVGRILLIQYLRGCNLCGDGIGAERPVSYYVERQEEQFDWYEPTVPADEFDENVFSDIERDNIARMQSLIASRTE